MRGTIRAGTVWGWNSSRQEYEQVDQLNAYTGVWVYVEGSGQAQLSVRGIEVAANGLFGMNLLKGWNLIGVDRALSAPTGAPVRGDFWYWQAEAGAYKPAATLEPLKGYWINLGEPILLEDLLSQPKRR